MEAKTPGLVQKLFRKQPLAIVGIVAILTLGAMGAAGTFSSDSNKPSLFASLAETLGLKEEDSNITPESLTPPQTAPQLSKKYIYAGSRMLAVEDYGVAPTPPPPTPTPTPGAAGGTPTPTPTPPPVGTSATFLGFDTTTQGNWTSGYGAQGYSIVSDTTSMPAWVTFSTLGNSTHTWAASTADVRALKRASNPITRVAATWYTTPANSAGAQFTINLNLTDGQLHRVALYALNWDNINRNEVFEVVNAATGVVLDTRSVSSFYAGTYLNWNAAGNITIRVRNVASTNVNAVVSGVFIDPPSTVSPTPTPTPTPNSCTPSYTTLRRCADSGGSWNYTTCQCDAQ